MKTKQNISISTFVKVILTTFSLSIVLTGCEIQESFDYVEGNSDGILEVNAWEFIQTTDSLSLLEEAITLAGVQSYYSGSDVKTFIAPRNSAFRTYMKTNSYHALSEIPNATLEGILKYHIVKATVLFSDPTMLSNNPISYDTESGSIMYLSRDANYQGLINQGTKKSWTIITSNIQPTNGVLHVTSGIVYLSL